MNVEEKAIVDNSEEENEMILDAVYSKLENGIPGPACLNGKAGQATLNTKHDLVDPVNPVKKQKTISQRPTRPLRLKENPWPRPQGESHQGRLQVSRIRSFLPTGQAIDPDKVVLTYGAGNQKPILLASLNSIPTNNVSEIAETDEEQKIPKSLAKTAGRNVPAGQAEIQDIKSIDSVKNKFVNRKSEIVNRKCSGLDPQYTYDLNGNRETMITPYGTFIYTYDGLSRLKTITNPNNEVTTFVYDDISRRTSRTFDNGIVTTFAYDTGSRLTNMLTRNSQLATRNP